MRDAPLAKQRPFRLKPVVIPERVEQEHLARWLDYRQILFSAIPNGGKRDARTGAQLKRSGVKAGVPDLLIFDTPKKPQYAHARGVAIELKTSIGTCTERQLAWHKRLTDAGWLVRVCRGSPEAIAWLQSLGF